MFQEYYSRGVAVLLGALGIWNAACTPSQTGLGPVLGPKDSPESRVGERIFREPRFSKFFFQKTGGNPNSRPAEGDPVLTRVSNLRRGFLKGPFSDQAMSCVACHMVDDAKNIPLAGMRGYTDFSQRSPIPRLDEDLLTTTPRNSPTLINAFIDRPGPFLLHYDGEFATIEDLVIGSYVGRNFGWLPTEKSQALANIVNVIRQDNGKNDLGMKFGGGTSYRELLLAQSRSIPKDTLIPESYRIDISQSDDSTILNTVAALVKAYLQALVFARDPVTNVYTGSAYDHFLASNHLPQLPNPGESDIQYSGRLAWALQKLSKPTFVHDDAGDFGARELDGLRIFLATSRSPSQERPGYFQVGNCTSCHSPPHFTDFRFHNTGASQEEYDDIHGQGSFLALKIPSLAERRSKPENYLPANEFHPNASGIFRSPPTSDNITASDLGAWNIFLNPDYPASQKPLEQIFCEDPGCNSDAALSRSVAAFKTPGIRELGLSDPYLHTGRMQTIPDVLRFYQRSSDLQRAGLLRNGAPELSKIQIDNSAVNSLTAFLNSLNEDYE